MKAAGSPKVGKLSPVVKKESMDGSEQPTLQRRASVSSSNGSAGNGASSDWDDSGKFLLFRVSFQLY